MMTIAEAARNWGMSERAILRLINGGCFFGMSVRENRLYLPDLPKPYRPRTKKEKAQQIDRCILSALNNSQYLNQIILGVSKQKFSERLDALQNAEKIYQSSDIERPTTKVSSTLGYSISAKQASHNGQGLTLNVNAVNVSTSLNCNELSASLMTVKE